MTKCWMDAMSEEHVWPGMASLQWIRKENRKKQTVGHVLFAMGIGPVAETTDSAAFVLAHHPAGRGLMRRIPGSGTKEGCIRAVTAVYGEDACPLPTEEEFSERWQEWMEGLR